MQNSNRPPHTMSIFCRLCSSLNLSAHVFFRKQKSVSQQDTQQKAITVSLGDLHDVRLRASCPSCRLAVKAFESVQSNYKQEITQNKPIYCKLGLSPIEAHRNDSKGKENRPVLSVLFSPSRTAAIHFAPTVECALNWGANPSNLCSRYLMSPKGKCGLLKQWLYKCETDKNHAAICNESQASASILPKLLVIDVQEQCLVEAPSDCRYVALSYVWGLAPFFCLRKENIKSLRMRGGFAAYSKNVPRTIQDAIYLVQQISERYLWVDSLCIIQDESAQKDELINSMDLVYGGSLITVIAMTGSDADSGLFTNKAADAQIEIQITGDLTLLAINSYTLDISHHNWYHERRAWT